MDRMKVGGKDEMTVVCWEERMERSDEMTDLLLVTTKAL